MGRGKEVEEIEIGEGASCALLGGLGGWVGGWLDGLWEGRGEGGGLNELLFVGWVGGLPDVRMRIGEEEEEEEEEGGWVGRSRRRAARMLPA